MMAHEARQKQLRKQLNRTCGDVRRANAQEKEYAVKVEAANLHNNNLSAEEERLQFAVGDLKKRMVCHQMGLQSCMPQVIRYSRCIRYMAQNQIAQ